MHKIRTHHKHEHGKIFSWLVFIAGFSVGLSLPIFPNFIKSILGTDSYVSLFYSAMAIVMFLGALISTILFKKIERSIITRVSLLVLAGAFLFFIITTRLTELAILCSLQLCFILFLIMSLSLFVRDFAKNSNLGEEEGMFFKFHNLGYLLGPLAGGFLATYLSYEAVFITTAIAFIIGLIYFYHLHIIKKHPAIRSGKATHDLNLFKNIKQYIKDPNRVKIYMITLALMSWVGFKRIYIPLYVVFSGYIESMTGIILALSIIPLIFLEVRVGEYADKKGIRKPISIGFLIMALSLLFVYFNPNIFINFIILILANIGNSFVEPLQEYFLFKNMSEKEEDNLYGVYMTADPLAYFLTPLIGAVILLFFPFNYLFLVFGVGMLCASAFSWISLRHS